MVVEDVVAAVADHEPHIVLGAVGVVRRAGDVVAGLGPLIAELGGGEHDLHRPERAVVQVHRHLIALPGAVLAHKSTEHACSKGHRGVPIPDRCRPVDGLEVIGLRQRGEEAAASTIGRGVESLAIALRTVFPIAAHLRPDEVGMARMHRFVVETELL